MPSCRKTQSDRRTARSLHQQIQRPDHRGAQAGPYQLRNFGTRQKPLLDLEQDAAQTDSLRGGLRPVRHPDRLPAAAVPLGKDTVLADILDYHRHLYAETGSPARLDFDAQGQRLRSVALDCYGSRRSMGRGADPHATHGGDRRKGIRRSLEIQKRLAVEQRGRTRPLAQKDTRCTEWSDGKRR